MSEENRQASHPYMYGMKKQMSPPYQHMPPHQDMPMPQYQQMPYPAPPIPGQQWQSYPPYFPWPQPEGQLRIEESYIENILRLNRGKIATVYMTFENNDRWNAKVFKGIIEAAGRDHIILSDPETEMRYLLLSIYLDYITFDGEISYDYPIR